MSKIDVDDDDLEELMPKIQKPVDKDEKIMEQLNDLRKMTKLILFNSMAVKEEKEKNDGFSSPPVVEKKEVLPTQASVQPQPYIYPQKVKKEGNLLRMMFYFVGYMFLFLFLTLLFVAVCKYLIFLSWAISFGIGATLSLIISLSVLFITKSFSKGKKCPFCESKLQKTGIVKDGEGYAQFFKCTNPMCEYKERVAFNE